MPIIVPALPPLEWTGVEGDASVDAATGALTLTAAAGVDWTNDALGGTQQQAATAAAFPAPAEFTLSARVSIEHERSTFDAGAIAIWSDADHWAKICFEYSPHGERMIVSVVTNGYSDDCNSTLVDDNSAFLRVTRTGEAWAFHSSADGERWDFVRVFRLGGETAPVVGFLSQAPLGDRCVARFDRIALTDSAPSDLRDRS